MTVLPRGKSMVGILAPKFGRYYVQHQIGVGATGLVYCGRSPHERTPVAIKALGTCLPPDMNQRFVDELNLVIDRLPPHPSIVTPQACGLEGQEPYFVSELAPGKPLDEALERFGPGAIADVLPRLQAIAEGLDHAAEHGFCHGALHPTDVMVSVASTVVTGIGIPVILAKIGVGTLIRESYAAPELMRGEAASNASDQFSLAVIAFEWLFGEMVPGEPHSLVDVPALPDVNHGALSNAFRTALASSPSARFASCRAFADSISAAVHRSADPVVVDQAAGAQDPEPALELDDEANRPIILEDGSTTSSLSNASNVAFSWRRRDAPGLALAATLVLGMAVGFAGGYVANRPQLSIDPVPVPSASVPVPSVMVEREPQARLPVVMTPVQDAAGATSLPVALNTTAAANDARIVAGAAKEASQPPTGRLLVSSTPIGATVKVDGVMRGVTPLDLSALELGLRTVGLSRPGYVAVERRVTLTRSRPSRSLEVGLSPVARPTATQPARAALVSVPPVPSRPATIETGSLVIESQPSGAAVTVNGMPRGRTPITIGTLPAGNHVVTIALAKFNPVSMTVQVTAGQRARVSPTLTSVEPQE